MTGPNYSVEYIPHSINIHDKHIVAMECVDVGPLTTFIQFRSLWQMQVEQAVSLPAAFRRQPVVRRGAIRAAGC